MSTQAPKKQRKAEHIQRTELVSTKVSRALKKEVEEFCARQELQISELARQAIIAYIRQN